MGNASSAAELPPEWDDILPNVTREDIVRSCRKKVKVADEDKHIVYLHGEHFDLDEHIPMALAILRAHPHLKVIRFNLVPGKLSEERFWAAVFGILHDGGINIEEVAGSIGDDYETDDEIDGGIDLGEDDALLLTQSPVIEARDRARNEKVGPNHASESPCNETNTPPIYLDEIKAQQAHINRLLKSLREANHKSRKLALELHRERKKRHDEGTHASGSRGKDHSGSVASCPRCNSSLNAPQRPHSGTWEMHPDCNEFMKLDAHMKENLRKEKEKRINEVMSQMKFILDTDAIEDSYGKWSCCGREEYETECGK